MVKDVSASCANQALRAYRIIRWTAAALVAFGSMATAAELPASLSLQQPSAGLTQTSERASPLQPFDISLPGSSASELFQSGNAFSQQQAIFPLGHFVELNVAMGGSNKSSLFAQDYTSTTGVWKPVENLSFKAGIGVIQQNYGASPEVAYALPAPTSSCATGTSNYLDCLASRATGGQESSQTYMIGASWNAFGRVSLSLDYSNRNRESTATELGSAALIDQIVQPGAFLSSRTQALDFSLSCEFGAGNWGDLELGLQVSRIMTEGGLADIDPGDSLTDPYTQASLGVGWKLGDFRSDFTSRYLDVLDGQGNSLEPWTSLDVNFSWRTPWNGSLSVGARNVFNNPAPENSGLTDPNYDELFGRVPYVRYRQDL